MAVMAVVRVPGMNTQMYDNSTEQLVPLVKQQPGFIMHTALATDDGFTITEFWESEEAANNWYNNFVRPASEQAGIPPFQPEFQNLHNLVTP